MTMAIEQVRPGARVPESWLIAPAGKAGYIPLMSLSWLEPLRERHERLAEQLATAVLVPERVRQAHDAAVAAWSDDVRAAARSGDEPSERGVRLSPAWLAGRIDAAEAAIAELVDELLAVLREAEAAFGEHEAEIDALVAQVEDGFGGALVNAERAAAGEPPLPPSPLLAAASTVARWRRVETVDGRAAVAVDLQELANYTRRRQKRRPNEREVIG